MAARGSKLALLVGCNYANKPDPYRRYGCINDVNAMSALLQNHFQFQPDDITILIDEPNHPEKPTQLNIKNGLDNMIQMSRPNAILFFYFSGNGVLAKRSDGSDKGIPAIVSSDYGLFTANDFLPLLEELKNKRPGATFTFVCDSSYSGGLFDVSQIEFSVGDSVDGKDFGLKTIPSDHVRPAKPAGPNLSVVPPDNGILLSSSMANQESMEVYPNCDKSKAYGAFSNGIQILLNALPNVRLDALTTNQEVVGFVRGLLGFLRFRQQPYIRCSVRNEGARFLRAPEGA